jgi:hypothetical protein
MDRAAAALGFFGAWIQLSEAMERRPTERRHMNTITLRFPRKLGLLSPNARPNHWAEKARAVKEAKHAAAFEAMALGCPLKPLLTACEASITIVGGERMDADNITASAKAYLDGLSRMVYADDRAIVRVVGQWRESQWWEQPHLEIVIRQVAS